PIIGSFFANDTDKEIRDKAMQCAEITHAHDLGKEGAAIIAQTTAYAYRDLVSRDLVNALLSNDIGTEYRLKLELVAKWLDSSLSIDAKLIQEELGNGIAALDSCVTAIYIAVTHLDKDFRDLLDTCIKVKGDVDTIAAMAGGIWGARNGYRKLPNNLLDRIEKKDYLTSLSMNLSEKIHIKRNKKWK
ncbi:MAG: ADP-ribosylglycohydrolase family protein, partial [Kangiellaceae bacterium]|nr:ADP-ribosylglycohydrolase family protein [Kangiellaceae bacterium]